MVILKNIQVSEYAHPEERAALQALQKAKIVKVALDWLANQQNRLMLKTQVLGNCVGIMEKDNPQLYRVLTEVCQVLDYGPVPRVYSYHSPSFDIGIYAGAPALLVIPDFLLNEFDEGMLRFQLGRAISALKADTCQLKMLAQTLVNGTSALSIPGLDATVRLMVADWSRKAGLTEDRAGLLACQDIYVAEKALMRTAGMPVKYLDPTCIVEYIQACQQKPMLASAYQYLQTVGRMESWNNDRIVTLYQWHYSGEYHDIIEEYE